MFELFEKSGCVRLQPEGASERPEMVNKSCTPPSGVPLELLMKRTSRTGPLAVMNGGAHAVLTWTNGGVSVTGGFAYSSDRNMKTGFAALDPQKVLAQVAALPMSSWFYKTDTGARHVGPMAQDFHAAFALGGGDDKHINVGDEGGVALAAIQGLNEKVESGKQKAETQMEKLEAENARLKQQNDSLAGRLNALEATVKQLAANK